MGLNHDTICFKANSDKVKFVNGGLETYEGILPSDLSFQIMHRDIEAVGNIKEFSWARDPHLYSWLIDRVTDIAPYPNYRECKKKAREFVNWLDKTPLSLESGVKQLGPNPYIYEDDDVCDSFIDACLLEGDGLAFFPLKYLLEFDFDAVAQLTDRSKLTWCAEEFYEYTDGTIPHPDGLTYRQVFTTMPYSTEFFEFLEKAKEAKWEAVLFCVS